MQTNIPQSVIQTSKDEFHVSYDLEFVQCRSLQLANLYYDYTDQKYHYGHPSTEDYKKAPDCYVLFKKNFRFLPKARTHYIKLAVNGLNEYKKELLPVIHIEVHDILREHQYYFKKNKDLVPLQVIQKITGMDKLIEQLESN